MSTEAKPSISAHIHRDGGIHIALTEKASNKCDQLTLPAPLPAAAPTTTSWYFDLVINVMYSVTSVVELKGATVEVLQKRPEKLFVVFS